MHVIYIYNLNAWQIFIVIGCGTGNYLIALSEFVGKVTGLELSEGMLKKAREKTAHLKNVEVMQGDITDMPYPDGHFDAICCNMVRHDIVHLCHTKSCFSGYFLY